MTSAARPSLLPTAMLGLLLSLSACAGNPSSKEAPSVTRIDCEQPVTTGTATYHGKRDASACAWQGIPFGEAPVDELRFQYARPSTVTGDIDATTFGASCLQPPGIKPEGFGTALHFDEDCLNLNIWAPGQSPDGTRPHNLPVMVWIFGGGFTAGSGNTNLYNGESLAGHDVIVVTINYRLGALGWLHIPGAEDDGGRPLTGNLGFSDQILALEWVRDHIAPFGGDPDRVTLFGESAGAYSVCSLLASPKAEGLFHGAIMQSGACTVAEPVNHEAESRRWIADAGCPPDAPDSLTCLRTLTPEFLTTQTSWPLFQFNAPVVDGRFLTDQPLAVLEQGGGGEIPVLAGMNFDELKLLGLGNMDLLRKKSEDWHTTWERIEEVAGRQARLDLQTLYPEERYASPFDMLVALGSDVVFGCPARGAVAAAEGPAYLYRFRIEPNSFVLEPYLGTFHASEIPFMFGNYNVLTFLYTDSFAYDRALQLSRTMQGYWTRFAATGDPNGPGLPQWPAYAEAHMGIELTQPVSVTEDMLKAKCEVFDRITPQDLNDRFFAFLPALAGIRF